MISWRPCFLASSPQQKFLITESHVKSRFSLEGSNYFLRNNIYYFVICKWNYKLKDLAREINQETKYYFMFIHSDLNRQNLRIFLIHLGFVCGLEKAFYFQRRIAYRLSFSEIGFQKIQYLFVPWLNFLTYYKLIYFYKYFATDKQSNKFNKS